MYRRMVEFEADLELVRHHVSKSLVVDRPNEDVGPEGFSSVPTDHSLPCKTISWLITQWYNAALWSNSK